MSSQYLSQSYREPEVMAIERKELPFTRADVLRVGGSYLTSIASSVNESDY